MAKACATLEEFLRWAPEFASVGPVSTAELAVTFPVAPGATITILDDKGTLPRQLTLTEGVDFSGANADAVAAAIVVALNDDASYVEATSIGAVVYVASLETGDAGRYTVSSSDASLAWSSATLEGGDLVINQALECTCAQINLGCWGEKASCGHAYLAAHFLALQTGIDASGNVKRRKIDKLEIEFGIYNPMSSLESTRWGQLYMQTKRTLFVPGIAGRRC